MFISGPDFGPAVSKKLGEFFLIAWSRYGEQICAPLRRLSTADPPDIVARF
jgi:hypothetical protein